MPVVLGKSKSLVPRGIKEIRYVGHVEKKCLAMSLEIARQFGEKSKKMKPKKIYFR
jgi:hypothetical protein